MTLSFKVNSLRHVINHNTFVIPCLKNNKNDTTIQYYVWISLILEQRIEFFVRARISKFKHPAQRYNDCKLIKLKKRAKLLLSSLPVSPSRVLRSPGTSLYHLVLKHLRATWPRPEQSHLLPEACSPNGTDKRRQRQRRTNRPPLEPILKRFDA